MAACAACGCEFSGTPWRYAPEGRVHVDCTATPPEPSAAVAQRIDEANAAKAEKRLLATRIAREREGWAVRLPLEKKRDEKRRKRMRGSRHGGKKPQSAVKQNATKIRARFAGHCGLCGKPVLVGEWVSPPKWDHTDCVKGGGR